MGKKKISVAAKQFHSATPRINFVSPSSYSQCTCRRATTLPYSSIISGDYIRRYIQLGKRARRRKEKPVRAPHTMKEGPSKKMAHTENESLSLLGASVASCIDTTTTTRRHHHHHRPLTTTRCYPPSVSPHRRLRKNLLSPLRRPFAFIPRDFHHLRLYATLGSRSV